MHTTLHKMFNLTAALSLTLLLACGDDAGETAGLFGSDAESLLATNTLETAQSESYSTPDSTNWFFLPTGNTHIEDIIPSQSPHGPFAQIFVNKEFHDSVGTSEPAIAAEGSIIIKHNLTADDASAIDSITVMVKRETGFAPETLDWFWAKFSPSGEVLRNPDGVRLAGLIGAVGGGGCIGCHSTASDDYVRFPVQASFGAATQVALIEDTMATATTDGYTSPDDSKWFIFPTGTDDAENIVTSAAPHGDYAQIFVNKTFHDSVSGEPATPAEGSVIIKHNLTDKDASAVAAITVMIKQPAGYDPATKDWFWAKLDRDGNVASNDAGTPLAGKIGKVGGGGCIGCHSAADDDYVVTPVVQ